MRQIRVNLVVIALLTAITIANIVLLYNIIKLFLTTKPRAKTMTVITAETAYFPQYSYKATTIPATLMSGFVSKSDVAVSTSPSPLLTSEVSSVLSSTTLGHLYSRIPKLRRKYRFDEKLGKYVRVRKKPLTPSSFERTEGEGDRSIDQHSEQLQSSSTQSMGPPVDNHKVTDHIGTTKEVPKRDPSANSKASFESFTSTENRLDNELNDMDTNYWPDGILEQPRISLDVQHSLTTTAPSMATAESVSMKKPSMEFPFHTVLLDETYEHSSVKNPHGDGRITVPTRQPMGSPFLASVTPSPIETSPKKPYKTPITSPLPFTTKSAENDASPPPTIGTGMLITLEHSDTDSVHTDVDFEVKASTTATTKTAKMGIMTPITVRARIFTQFSDSNVGRNKISTKITPPSRMSSRFTPKFRIYTQNPRKMTTTSMPAILRTSSPSVVTTSLPEVTMSPPSSTTRAHTTASIVESSTTNAYSSSKNVESSTMTPYPVTSTTTTSSTIVPKTLSPPFFKPSTAPTYATTESLTSTESAPIKITVQTPTMIPETTTRIPVTAASTTVEPTTRPRPTTTIYKIPTRPLPVTFTTPTVEPITRPRLITTTYEVPTRPLPVTVTTPTIALTTRPRPTATTYKVSTRPFPVTVTTPTIKPTTRPRPTTTIYKVPIRPIPITVTTPTVVLTTRLQPTTTTYKVPARPLPVAVTTATVEPTARPRPTTTIYKVPIRPIPITVITPTVKPTARPRPTTTSYKMSTRPPSRAPFYPTTTKSAAPTTTSAEDIYQRRLSGFTVVTALLDIGRGNWWEYRRPLSSYYKYLDNLLELRANLMIFVDPKSVDYVRQKRQQFRLEHMTKIVPIHMRDLPLYPYIGLIREIIKYELYEGGWRESWDDSMKTHPEAKSAEYDVLVNSKTWFLYNASIVNPFETERFVWLDGGYGHGNRTIFPSNFYWHLSIPPNQISVIKVTPEFDDIRKYTLTDLYRKNWAVISGGFLGGDRYSVNRFHRFYQRIVFDLISQRLIDDDQTSLVLLIQQQPKLFNVVCGDWFDAFRLFSA